MGDNTHGDSNRFRLRAKEMTFMTDSPEQQVHTDEIEGLVAPADIRSTSRSCLVIILTGLLIVLMLCVFFVVQTWVR